MSGIAIMMMILFMVVIWGGLLVSIFALRKHPDDSSGILGDSHLATDDVLIEQEKAGPPARNND
ncbi:methionine/alanine import NSS transporter subunit MetS [Corynebacterium sp. TAE3-ERU16]|uniref:methionine/alanine import NSS transporter subunit MetS n=1 Tax=Corynebacterium sp. TAE3-ERU16 TaxID=2849493 RepID=UPI001C45FA8A|nr:methionine/alanine import NSS transporter subunit MetS [Corynebacterium sp. TAE3-ERU16]MBV7293196.1 methionine/alanine import NSS transporter subunit MetS [Corynebacterium sp. TAE3-ERU16]